MASEKVNPVGWKEIPMSLKCILIGAAIVAGGYYVYKHKKRFHLG
jgi:hypothetical protein